MLTDLVFHSVTKNNKRKKVTCGLLEWSASLGGVNMNYYLAALGGNDSPHASSVPVALSFCFIAETALGFSSRGIQVTKIF